METKRKRIAMYVRVSTNDQSTELQKLELLDYIKARGWNEYEIYEDAGKTGTNDNRPALKKLLIDAKARKIDAVLIWKLDRLFRSLKHLVITLQEFQDLGIDFISIKDQIDLTTASGKLLMHLLGAFGEFEASLIRERVRAGLKAAKAKGKHIGRPLTRDDEKILALHTRGLSFRKIAEELSISASAVQRAVTASKGAQNSCGTRPAQQSSNRND